MNIIPEIPFYGLSKKGVKRFKSQDGKLFEVFMLRASQLHFF